MRMPPNTLAFPVLDTFQNQDTCTDLIPIDAQNYTEWLPCVGKNRAQKFVATGGAACHDGVELTIGL
jgi:hypothetical protein